MIDDLAVVIVNFRTPARSAALAAELAESGAREVVVVDNSPPDGEEIAVTCDGLAVQVVSSGQNIGFGAACNLGARSTTRPVLLFLNSDISIDHASLERLAAAFVDEQIDIAAPRILTLEGTPQHDAAGIQPSLGVLLRRRNRHGNTQPVFDWVSGAVMAVRRTAFDTVGGFDERLHMYFEDVDLCRRVGASHVRRIDQAVATHDGGMSRSSDLGRQRHYALSQWRYLAMIEAPLHVRLVATIGTWVAFAGRSVWTQTSHLLRLLLGRVRETTRSSWIVSRPGPRLNLGCGESRAHKWINVDSALNDHVRPDVVADLHQLPFRGRSMRSIYCGHVLEHLPYPEAVEAVRNLRDLLATDGQLLAVGPDVRKGVEMVRSGTMTPPELQILRFGEHRWPGDEHRWECDQHRLERLLREAGLRSEPENVTTVCGWPLSSRALWQCAVRGRR